MWANAGIARQAADPPPVVVPQPPSGHGATMPASALGQPPPSRGAGVADTRQGDDDDPVPHGEVPDVAGRDVGR